MCQLTSLLTEHFDSISLSLYELHVIAQDIYFCLVTSCQLKCSPNSFMRTVSSTAKRAQAL